MEGKYTELGKGIGKLVDSKQKSYGDSFSKSGQLLRVLYPDGIEPEKYEDILVIVRIIDKLFRIANDPTAFNESPWEDIAGYALLAHKRFIDDINIGIIK